MKNTLLWIIALIITLAGIYYTRTTGPTKPVKGKAEIAGQVVEYSLIRTFPRPMDAPVRITVADELIGGYYRYKRTPSHDEWNEAPLVRKDDQLIAYLPQQPAAGKVAYQITLTSDHEEIVLTSDPIVLRFRNNVPAWAMIPHILLMFAAIFLSTRAGLAGIFAQKTYGLTLATLVVLVAGGLIFGPIVQKYAFGDFWTGWPFGTDLTDNKTAIMFVFWLAAFFRTRKKPYDRWWVVTAAVVTMIAYLIPHSLMGSEIDFTQEMSQ